METETMVEEKEEISTRKQKRWAVAILVAVFLFSVFLAVMNYTAPSPAQVPVYVSLLGAVILGVVAGLLFADPLIYGNKRNGFFVHFYIALVGWLGVSLGFLIAGARLVLGV